MYSRTTVPPGAEISCTVYDEPGAVRRAPFMCTTSSCTLVASPPSAAHVLMGKPTTATASAAHRKCLKSSMIPPHLPARYPREAHSRPASLSRIFQVGLTEA